jgi:hypothetical protein
MFGQVGAKIPRTDAARQVPAEIRFCLANSRERSLDGLGHGQSRTLGVRSAFACAPAQAYSVADLILDESISALAA